VAESFLVGDLIWRRNGIYTQPARVVSLTPSGFRSASLSCNEIKNHRYSRNGMASGVTRLGVDATKRAHGQTYDDRRIGRMIANEDALARLGPRAVADLRRAHDLRAQRDALLEIVYSLPDLIQRAWNRDNSRRTQRDLDAITVRIDAAVKSAKERP
jgi:hypothetical protein